MNTHLPYSLLVVLLFEGLVAVVVVVLIVVVVSVIHFGTSTQHSKKSV